MCVNGKEQELATTIGRLMLLSHHGPPLNYLCFLSSIMDLETRQVDTQAFPQVELTDPLFMRIPQGWYATSEGMLAQHADPKFNDTAHYMKLRRNLYGCKQAA
jgi:hypothetical protein